MLDPTATDVVRKAIEEWVRDEGYPSRADFENRHAGAATLAEMIVEAHQFELTRLRAEVRRFIGDVLPGKANVAAIGARYPLIAEALREPVQEPSDG